MHFLLILLLLIVFLPALAALFVFQIATRGLEALGFSPGLALAVLLLMIIGSFFNLPLSRRKLVEREEVRFFGLVRKTKLEAQGLSVNVGGAVIPSLLAAYFLLRIPLEPALWAIGLMTAVSFLLAKVIPGKGVALPFLIPPIFAVIIAFVLAPSHLAELAFASGVLGVLIGADILNLPRAVRQGGVLSIGGAGVFDGIVLIGLLSAFLAGLGLG